MVAAWLWHANHTVRHGIVYGPNTGIILRADPLLLRVPAVASITNDRLPADFDDGGYLQVVPDLVVEVVSPADRSFAVLAKAAMWLEHGTQVVWVVDPVGETVTVYPAAGAPLTLTKTDVVDGGSVFPEFSLAVADAFTR